MRGNFLRVAIDRGRLLYCEFTVNTTMKYYAVHVDPHRSFEYNMYLRQNYIMPHVDYTVSLLACHTTVEYRFERLEHAQLFTQRWNLQWVTVGA